MNDGGQTRRKPAVMIAGGGTGGHLFPGLAVAGELRRRFSDAPVTFIGTARGLEARVVPREGYPLDLIRSAGLKGKSLWALFRGFALLPVSFADAWRALSRRRPDVVIGVGGYSSGPTVLLASWRGIRTMVLEQNAVPGLTNRLLSRWVDAAAVSYDDTLAFFRGKGFVTGNPVRAEFFGDAEFDSRDGAAGSSNCVRLLVVGGSQGAHAVNVAMMSAAPALLKALPGVDLVHQTGERDLVAVREAYASAGVKARVEPFLDAMAAEMRRATLVVSRAGATSLAELAAAGRPALLVPFPEATDDHQRKNAALLESAGAAVVIDQRDLTGERLAGALERLLRNPDELRSMQAAMRRVARPDAAARIVDRAMALAAVTEVHP